MNNEKRKEKYRLLKKLMTNKFDTKELEFDCDNYQVDLKLNSICTAEVCLCLAIAKRTKASMYLNKGKFRLYIAIDKPISHYILWADKHIKQTIELEA